LGFDQTEYIAGARVKPVLEVLHPALSLSLEVAAMSVRNPFVDDAVDILVNV
jgi:hypothetical protein